MMTIMIMIIIIITSQKLQSVTTTQYNVLILQQRTMSDDVELLNGRIRNDYIGCYKHSCEVQRI